MHEDGMVRIIFAPSADGRGRSAMNLPEEDHRERSRIRFGEKFAGDPRADDWRDHTREQKQEVQKEALQFRGAHAKNEHEPYFQSFRPYFGRPSAYGPA